MTGPSPIIGIDLGTTFSAAAWFSGGKVQFFNNPLRETLTPSVVAYDARKKGLIVGRPARDILATAPAMAAATFKRTMGSDVAYQIHDRTYGSVELSAYVLDALRSDAEAELGRRVTQCVVTVPAYFNESQRHATKCAAELAGFRVERILNEPTAAAIAFGFHEEKDHSHFLVFDLGGGTFDVCVMELFEGILQVKGVAGESRLGGEDFTDRVVEFLLGRAKLDPKEAAEADGEALALLRKRAEMLKRQLSSWPAAEVIVPSFRDLLSDPVSFQVYADQLDRMYQPLLDRMIAPCRTALRSAELQPGALDTVILVGGAVRMPCIKRFVREELGMDPVTADDPDHVVARGAAIQAALCAEDHAVGDVVVTEVSSHSLGVEVSREIGGKRVRGFFNPVIHRNTVIPVSRSDVLNTIEANQKSVNLKVYEGESRRVEENFYIGNLVIDGIPGGPPGQDIEVVFTYDANGMLEVEARIVKTEQTFSRVFRRDGKELTEQELERAQAGFAALKADPREQIRYRDALARADLVWREAGSRERAHLEYGIRLLEEALDSRTPAVIESAYRDLVSLCESIDGAIRW